MKNIITHRNPFNLIDPFFDEFFTGESNSSYTKLMATDIVEEEDQFLLKINLPDIRKEDVKLSLKEGYLTIEANVNNSEEDEKSNYICKERYSGTFKRTFYLGEEINQEDVKAKLENGVLTLNIAKKQPEEEKEHFIAIE